MLKKISWLIVGLISLKIVNEIGYILINTSEGGVSIWKAFLPAFTGCLVLAFCFVKGDIFFEYSKRLETKKLNQIYKTLIVSFGISVVFMITYYFANSENQVSKLESPNNITSAVCILYWDGLKVVTLESEPKDWKDKYAKFVVSKFEMNVANVFTPKSVKNDSKEFDEELYRIVSSNCK
jgi:hypothetical protein